MFERESVATPRVIHGDGGKILAVFQLNQFVWHVLLSFQPLSQILFSNLHHAYKLHISLHYTPGDGETATRASCEFNLQVQVVSTKERAFCLLCFCPSKRCHSHY